ncbi:hypothetical protein BVX98_07335 [bacterium F11]|nr:hypothetical protein BVX98_07335 [bacterium F11]
MGTYIEPLKNALVQYTPGLAGALAILVIGWIGAFVLKGITRRTLALFRVNERLGSKDRPLNIEGGVSTGVYYLALLLVVLAVLNTLKLDIASAPFEALLTQVFKFLPNLVAGGVLILTAWLLATVVRGIVTKLISTIGADKRIGPDIQVEPISNSIGNVCYWFTFLVFLPAILGAFQLAGLLAPVQTMINELLGILPNVVGAVVIGFVGWLVSKVVGDLTRNLLSTMGADQMGQSFGLKGPIVLSRLGGLVVYIVIFVPALIAALNALKLESLTMPATEMLTIVLSSLPNILAAGVILVIVYVLAGFVSKLISNLMEGMGIDNALEKLGIHIDTQPSIVLGRIAFFFMMLFATVEAASRIGFNQMADIVSVFIQFGGQIILGSIIILVGLWLGGLVYNSLSKAKAKYSQSMAGFVRIVVLALVTAMGLRAMGVANDIVNLAFGLTLGAVAVAMALSFGLGGREAAGKQMEHWLKKFRD